MAPDEHDGVKRIAAIRERSLGASLERGSRENQEPDAGWGMSRDLLSTFFDWAKQPDPGPFYNYSIGFTLHVPGYGRGSYNGVLDYLAPRDKPGTHVMDDSLQGLGVNFWHEERDTGLAIGHYDTVSVSIERWPTVRLKLRMVDGQDAATARCVKLADVACTAISPLVRADAGRILKLEGSPQAGRPREHVMLLYKIGSAAVAPDWTGPRRPAAHPWFHLQSEA